MKHLISTLSRSIIFLTNHRILPTFTPPNFNLIKAPLRPTLTPSMPLSRFLGSLFGTSSSTLSAATYPAERSDEEWRPVLSPAQFRIIREKQTEPAFSGSLDKHYPSTGSYNCA